jgi:O-antigen/teichoic acid export membrane protein
LSIRRNTAYNLLGSAIPLAVSLVTIPIYLRLIGEARYGVLAIAWLLLGYFGLFDLGLGRATAQRIASLISINSSERAQTFWTALTLNVGLGVIGGLLIWPVASYFFGNVFKVEDALRPELQSAVPWLILAVPIATLSGVLTGALQGRERFLELSLISVGSTLLFQLLPLGAVVLWGANLGVILPAVILARLLTLLILFERCGRHLFIAHPVTFVRAEAGHLLRFGSWVTVTSFLGPMMVALDRLIIGAVADAKAVTYYAVPFQLGERSTIISVALTSALFPRFAASAPHEEQNLAQEALRTLVVAITPLVVAGVLFMGPFFTWWIDPEFAQHSTLVGQTILLGFWVNSFAKIPYAQLQARGRPDLVAKCHLAELLPYLGLLYLGLSTIGLLGAAVAFSIRAISDFVLLAGLAGILRTAIRVLLIPSILLVMAFVIAVQINPSRPEWLVVVPLQLLVTTAWAWWKAPTTIKELVLNRFKWLTDLLAKS